MTAWLMEWGVEIILTPPALWLFWKYAKARERQEDYRSCMNAYQRALERGDWEEAERLFAVAERIEHR